MILLSTGDIPGQLRCQWAMQSKIMFPPSTHWHLGVRQILLCLTPDDFTVNWGYPRAIKVSMGYAVKNYVPSINPLAPGSETDFTLSNAR